MGSAEVQGRLWGMQAQDFANYLEQVCLPLFGAVLDAARVTPSTRLLDAGCGAGLLALLASLRGARVTALDASSGLLAFARAPARSRCGRATWKLFPSPMAGSVRRNALLLLPGSKCRRHFPRGGYHRTRSPGSAIGRQPGADTSCRQLGSQGPRQVVSGLAYGPWC
jgi:SAM-dependent methyltransferase